jgi:hypothetical protein
LVRSHVSATSLIDHLGGTLSVRATGTVEELRHAISVPNVRPKLSDSVTSGRPLEVPHETEDLTAEIVTGRREWVLYASRRTGGCILEDLEATIVPRERQRAVSRSDDLTLGDVAPFSADHGLRRRDEESAAPPLVSTYRLTVGRAVSDRLAAICTGRPGRVRALLRHVLHDVDIGSASAGLLELGQPGLVILCCG